MKEAKNSTRKVISYCLFPDINQVRPSMVTPAGGVRTCPAGEVESSLSR